MTERSPKPPDALLQAIAQDLRPVKPSPKPMQLALRMVPAALLVSALILGATGIRRDSRSLGAWLTWGASFAEFALGILLVWVAAQESKPAGRLPRQVVYAAAAAAGLMVVAVSLVIFATTPEIVPRRIPAWIAGIACAMGSTIAGGILVGLFSWMFRGSIAARPTLAGALYGAGAGVAIHATWRMACPVSTLGHALGAHGMAIVATTLLGAVIGRSFGRRLVSGARR